ncbi:hypothetical protein MTR67_017565, partial [Solanum verrucosum]
TFLIRTTQLPKGITHSYKLGIAQIRRRWKDLGTIFPTLSEVHLNHPKLGVMAI